MAETSRPRVAIVDYGLGNLFSVKHACEHVGLQVEITVARRDIFAADAVILPGVGAFGDAMAALARLDLIGVLQDIAGSGKPLVGICLGMQLLMSESHEFGWHQGLGIIAGDVVRLQEARLGDRHVKVPQVGWNRILRKGVVTWEPTLLEGIPSGEFMYFVHSFYVRPMDPTVVLSTTCYGPVECCSSLWQKNIMAFQFHPERSGPQGVRIYQNLATHLTHMMLEEKAL